jgi:hypothetical protein
MVRFGSRRKILVHLFKFEQHVVKKGAASPLLMFVWQQNIALQAATNFLLVIVVV